MNLNELLLATHAAPNNDLFLSHLIRHGILPKQGTFFECGAWDGVRSSSTYRLEHLHGWSGLLVEAMPAMAARLQQNRPRSRAVMVAITNRDGDEVEFVEANAQGYSGIKSCLEAVSSRARAEGWTKDQWRAPGARSYQVPTLTLNTLFERYNASVGPTVMCLDMEGSEYAALAAFDFDVYGPDTITIEDADCLDLLRAKGYVRVRNPFNRTAPWEHCFVRQHLFSRDSNNILRPA